MEILLTSIIAAAVIFLFVKYAIQKGRNFFSYPDALIAGMAGIAIGFILNIGAIFFTGILFSLAGIANKAMKSRGRIEKFISINENKLFAVFAIVLILASIAMFFPVKPYGDGQPVISVNEALKLAQITNCGTENSITGSAIYYEGIHMWEVDMISNDIDFGSCHPVCVVDETTGKTRTIWTC